jgi:ketosteroid isomerase-like protein
MSKENVELIRAGYDAFRRKDLPAILALLHPGVEFHQSEEVPWGGRYKGHEQVQQFFARLLQTIDSKVETEQFIDAGNHVVQVGRTRGTAHATGKGFDVAEVHVWTLENGKVVRYEAYIDNPAMLAALR